LLFFKNRKLTTLEISIIYLKEKQLKTKEIAGLLKRDSRNISSTYINIKKKIKNPLNLLKN